MGEHAYESPEMDRLVEEVMANVGGEVEALRLPSLAGVVLGGGYGRGEGGVWERPGQPPALSNDLDFYVVTVPHATYSDIAAIGKALQPIAEKWTRRLGVDVDFCEAKTPWRLVHDQDRLMIQELVHGYFDVAGQRGEELFRGVSRRPPEMLPYTESLRLLVNRGAGLLLAEEPGRSHEFVIRNINKGILGAGDACLIASGRYRWKATERGEALHDELYSRALRWKFRPKEEAVCSLEEARSRWLSATEEVLRQAGRVSRSVYQAVRWLVRRRTVGNLRTLGLPPVMRILLEMRQVHQRHLPFPAALKKDWEVFN